MAIEWAPLFNVPWHRRLEVLSIATFLGSVVFLSLIFTFLIVYLLASLDSFHIEFNEIVPKK